MHDVNTRSKHQGIKDFHRSLFIFLLLHLVSSIINREGRARVWGGGVTCVASIVRIRAWAVMLCALSPPQHLLQTLDSAPDSAPDRHGSSA
uniref:Uncharacterized protein n=1 Tax=Knipowitschia caucasica TaxID=637954 RepID=A0AAV2JGB1_KNICA